MPDLDSNGSPDGNEGMSPSAAEVATIVMYDYARNITRILCTEQHCSSAECPENQALEIFGKYAQENPRGAAKYLVQYLDLSTAKGVFADQAALMFVGAIYCQMMNSPGYSTQTFTSDEWKSLAQEIAEKKKAQGYSTASRVALCGNILSFVCMTAEDNSEMASQLEKLYSDLDGALRASSPGEEQRVTHLGEHFLRAMKDMKYGEGSPISAFLKRISGK